MSEVYKIASQYHTSLCQTVPCICCLDVTSQTDRRTERQMERVEGAGVGKTEQRFNFSSGKYIYTYSLKR